MCSPSLCTGHEVLWYRIIFRSWPRPHGSRPHPLLSPQFPPSRPHPPWKINPVLGQNEDMHTWYKIQSPELVAAPSFTIPCHYICKADTVFSQWKLNCKAVSQAWEESMKWHCTGPKIACASWKKWVTGGNYTKRTMVCWRRIQGVFAFSCTSCVSSLKQ